MMKNINYLDQIFTQIGCMIENVKIPIDHHTILIFWLFQNLLILSHLSESFDVPAGCRSQCSPRTSCSPLGIHASTTLFKTFKVSGNSISNYFTFPHNEWYINSSLYNSVGRWTIPNGHCPSGRLDQSQEPRSQSHQPMIYIFKGLHSTVQEKSSKINRISWWASS